MNLEVLEENPPDVTLDHIAKDLVSFFNGFKRFNEVRRRLEKKCTIKTEREHKCWSEDNIKQAWRETIKKRKKSDKRRQRAGVIILQIVESFVCDMCKQNRAQKKLHATSDQQVCEMRRHSEDRISESEAELERAGAAGGDEQRRKQVCEASKRSDHSAPASRSQLSASRTDEANPSKSETKKALKNQVTLAKNCEQQKSIDLHNVHDKESERSKNGLRSTVRKEFVKARITDVEDGSPQGAAEGVKRKKISNQGQTSSNQSQTGTPFQAKKKSSGNDSGDSCDQSEEKRRKEGIPYIRIPLTNIIKPTSKSKTQTMKSDYELINGLPEKSENTDDPDDYTIVQKEFYVMLFNKEKNHAEWVYEILNKQTLLRFPRFRYRYKDDQKDPDYEEEKNQWGQKMS
ncbi:uncharacterized protein LOC122333376 [Puntigrus tetrazona]|uniref:uncharacterized protein LOC122333376 n=1 Tax=Puntigrus tetrazona TaxID=1606681 RepID=UPI001C8AE1F8|nr:uncharacterized protein LOC122333376 [Puntigrus tetrazona]